MAAKTATKSGAAQKAAPQKAKTPSPSRTTASSAKSMGAPRRAAKKSAASLPVAAPAAVAAPAVTAAPATAVGDGRPARAERYDPKQIEPKWQACWEADQLYRATIDPSRKKFYFLTMLPYPSGDLHIGHWYVMTPSDARARWLRMQGYNVMFPIGFDAFGLPAENAAIQRGIHPARWTYANIANMRKQLRTMGASWDWEREVVSSDPEYYRWTQWLFNQLFQHGLAYKKMAAVDWCPKDNTTLAREQVTGEARVCERCGTPVIRKNLEQWFFRITNYADELLDFSGMDWPENIKTLQTNWIGRSEGASVVFPSEDEDPIEVFTTRPDTLWGATFMVLAPEHPLVARLTSPAQRAEVEAYVATATRQTDIQRESTDKEKSGVFIGAYAVNPVNGERIPIWIADYVLVTYGTGAIMAVPAHDERDFAFALKFGLPILPVVARPQGAIKSFALGGTMQPGFAAALSAASIPFEERQGSLYITIPPGTVERYVELARHFLRPNAWNEIVGGPWLFIFPEGVRAWDSLPAERAILARAKELEPDVRGKRTVMEMLYAVEFYRDVLCHHEYGVLINSGPFTGTPGNVARKRVAGWLAEHGLGKPTVTYRIRDWTISRQRYWGAPIPIIYCPTHGQVPVPDDQLPVELPLDVEWLPTGQSPLKLHPTWSHTTCPICGGPATRDTDTMDTFMCSSWYHLRYLSPKYDQGPYDPREYDYWMPVDAYTGGVEHATMHLMYTRFFHKALRDMGITRGKEPMIQQRNQGQILGPDGLRMSKSRGNVIDPDQQVDTYGADVVRAYLMFGYQWSAGGPWNTDNIQGVVRWLNRVWTVVQEDEGRTPRNDEGQVTDPHEMKGAGDGSRRSEVGGQMGQGVTELRRIMHQSIKKVSDDFQAYEFNTIVSTLMEFTNALYKHRAELEGSPAWAEALDTLLKLMAPVTPHIAEELWVNRGRPYSIHQQSWPVYDPAAVAEALVTIVVQVNGKVRDRVQVAAGAGESEVKAAALASEGARRNMDGKEPRQMVVVPGRLVNIVL
jgi:leucyl-tRNA synthetase